MELEGKRKRGKGKEEKNKNRREKKERKEKNLSKIPVHCTPFSDHFIAPSRGGMYGCVDVWV